MSDPGRIRPPGSRTRLAGLGLSALCLLGVGYWALQQPAPQIPTDARGISLLMGAVAFYALATLVRGERWLELMRHGGAEPSRADAYALTAVGYMGNNLLRLGPATRSGSFSRHREPELGCAT